MTFSMTTDEMIKFGMIVELGVATSEELVFVKDHSPRCWKWNRIFNIVIKARTGFDTYDDFIQALMSE